ncbi:tudor domain-containing protein 15 [Mixophyes fleayi]|uniref:tudor domain-containing protein 15 n=1 Tax=Mixophyes fleayi TaxID=3061075 RepID=UPI003F4E1AA3
MRHSRDLFQLHPEGCLLHHGAELSDAGTDAMDYMSLTEKSDLKMDLKILNINCHPGDVLVKFQGKYISDSEFDYHILQKEIQLVPKVHEDIDIGEFCLVQDKPLGVWHRGKIWDKVKQTFEVALIDLGKVVKVGLPQIALATGELFTLPPKVVNGIFSNLLPLDEKWTSRAVNYFSSLVGEQLNGQVQIFLPHQVILLDVPKVISHAIEFNLAKYMDSDSFCLLVEILHKVPTNSHSKQMPDLLQQKKLSDISLSLNDNFPRFQKILDHLRPDICVGTMEKLKISAALSPDRFYCRILSWEAELNKLSASMRSHYETVQTEETSTLGSFGVLCAAKRNDGLWCRGIIQTLISCNEVKVWFIDVGSSETILSSYVQKLQPEFLSLPMMAIPCALSRANDHIESVKKKQFEVFKEALMGHVVIGHINNFCSDERLFFISLYDKEYELNAKCHLTNKQVPFFSPNSYTEILKSECDGKEQSIVFPETFTLEQDETISYKSIQMDLESVHVVYVEYVLNPSNFWIRTDECQNEFSAMMAEIAERYSKCELTEMVLQDPKPGQLCCALYAKDRHYYRAVVTEVISPQISVYFIDFGNTETIPFYDIKVLLPHFSALPALAMCCTLAHAYPLEDVWIKSANDFFKQIVSGKALLCHVLTKQKYKYVVEVRLSENSESSDIVTLLVEAGYAEFWKINLNSSSLIGKSITVQNYRSKKDQMMAVCTWTLNLKAIEPKSSFYTPPKELLLSSVSPVYYKQYIFKPGSLVDVKCSHMESPRNFWCQLSSDLPKLAFLMDEIQKFYVSCRSKYQHGQIACVAKSSRTGKFYRAAIMKRVSRNEVDVVCIDYGNTERVLVSELREIKPQFLTLEGQAFRCCLSAIISPLYLDREWSVNACEDFRTFVDSAHDVMKCTIIALFSIGSEDLCNAVNLESPFGNANQLLASKGLLVLRRTVPSIHLHTFCYSSFDIEMGREEDVYITFVYNTGRFYCQLAKNDKIFDSLMKKVSKIGEQIKSGTVTKAKNLCIVKYNQDGNFYRALACPVESSSLLIAFFVDFGDSQVVKKSELLPIPEEATDIFFQPMQAIPCYLSGLKEAPLTTEAKAWFEDQCVGKLLNAVVVSRDIEGQLELELHCGNISVNKKIRELLCMHPLEAKTKKALDANSSNAKPNNCGDVDTTKDQKKIQEFHCHRGENACKTIYLSDLNGNEIPVNQLKSFSDNPKDLQETSLFDSVEASKSRDDIHVNASSWSRTNHGKLVKCIDLPQVVQEAGHNCLVYVSHVNNPSSFYLQLKENENQIMQLGDDLNDMSFQIIDVKDLGQGSLVVAQYPDDELFYRAEVKEILQDNSFEVEFIDYGNTAHVNSSCIFKLPEKFLTIPKLSVSVFLTGVEKLQNSSEWGKQVIEKFSEIVSNEPVNCEFLCKHDTRWEVNITWKGQSVLEELLQSFVSPPKQPSMVGRDCPSKSELSYFHVSNKTMREEVVIPNTSTIVHEFNSQILKPGQIEKVKHIYIANCGMLFVNLAEYSEEPKLSAHISATLKRPDNRLMLKDISEGMPCLAKSDKMQAWLRATIEKVFRSTRKIAVFFVDHGAREIISVHNAKRLTAAELLIPKQAVPCTWSWTSTIGKNVFKTRMQSILPKEIQIMFLTFLESINAWKVEILVNGLLLMQYLNRKYQKAENKRSNAESCCPLETQSLPSPIQRASLKLLQIYPGFVTSFHDPSNFFVQLGDSIDIMNNLSQLMQKLPDDLLPLAVDTLRPGSIGLMKCFAENEWCRSEIVSINMNSILLYILDFGVYKSIPYSDFGKLKRISDKLVCLPALTYHCTLHGVLPKVSKCWSKDAVGFFIHFVQNHDLLILPIRYNGRNLTEVSLYGDGNLAHKLVSKGLAIDCEQRGTSAQAAADTCTSTYSFQPLSYTNQNLQDVCYNENSAYIDSHKVTLNPSALKWNLKHYLSEEVKLDHEATFPLHKSHLQPK